MQRDVFGRENFSTNVALPGAGGAAAPAARLNSLIGNRAAGQVLGETAAPPPAPKIEEQAEPTLAAGQFVVTIKGSKQGAFGGGSGKGPKKLAGSNFFFQVGQPQQQSTGNAAGKRQYSPVAFTKEWDMVSEQILLALTQNEPIEEIRAEIPLPGQQKERRIMTFRNCRFIGLTQESAGAVATERVSFVFESYETQTGGVSTSDTWSRQI